MDEFDIIARYFAPLAGEGAFGLADDAAALPLWAGHDLIVTTDSMAVASRVMVLGKFGERGLREV